jgi:hypothetical protein
MPNRFPWPFGPRPTPRGGSPPASTPPASPRRLPRRGSRERARPAADRLHHAGRRLASRPPRRPEPRQRAPSRGRRGALGDRPPRPRWSEPAPGDGRDHPVVGASSTRPHRGAGGWRAGGGRGRTQLPQPAADAGLGKSAQLRRPRRQLGYAAALQRLFRSLRGALSPCCSSTRSRTPAGGQRSRASCSRASR